MKTVCMVDCVVFIRINTFTSFKYSNVLNMSLLMTVHNPVYRNYVFWTGVLILKMLAMSLLTGCKRFHSRVHNKYFQLNHYYYMYSYSCLPPFSGLREPGGRPLPPGSGYVPQRSHRTRPSSPSQRYGIHRSAHNNRLLLHPNESAPRMGHATLHVFGDLPAIAHACLCRVGGSAAGPCHCVLRSIFGHRIHGREDHTALLEGRWLNFEHLIIHTYS